MADKPLNEMIDEERAALTEEAVSAMEAVTLGIEQETMACLRCGKPARVYREPMAWTVECACGWNAAGSGPPKRKN